MVQLKEFLGRLLGPLLNISLLLMTSVLEPLAKSVSFPLGLMSAVSETDAAIQKNYFESQATALIISNEEMNGIMKIVKSL